MVKLIFLSKDNNICKTRTESVKCTIFGEIWVHQSRSFRDGLLRCVEGLCFLVSPFQARIIFYKIFKWFNIKKIGMNRLKKLILARKGCMALLEFGGENPSMPQTISRSIIMPYFRNNTSQQFSFSDCKDRNFGIQRNTKLPASFKHISKV